MNGRGGRVMREVARLGWSGGIGAALLLAAAVLAGFLTGPETQRRVALERELAGLEQKAARQVQSLPTETPEQQLAAFRASLPRQGELNSLIENLHAVAAGRGLALRNGEYRASAAAAGLGRMQVSFKTEGSYGDLRGFLAAAQAAVPALALGRCTLVRQRIADTKLEATLEFQFLYATE